MLPVLDLTRAVEQWSAVGLAPADEPAAITVFVVGHSHTLALREALNLGLHPFPYPIKILNLKFVSGAAGTALTERAAGGDERLHPQLREQLKTSPDDSLQALTVSMIGGNAHNILGLLRHPQAFDFSIPDLPDLPLMADAHVLPYDFVWDMMARFADVDLRQLCACRASVAGPMVHLQSPPPVGDDEHVGQNLDAYFKKLQDTPQIAPRSLRYKLWYLHSRIVERRCAQIGVRFVPVPAETQDAEGFLRSEGYSSTATHANAWYGARVLARLAALADAVVAGVDRPVPVEATTPTVAPAVSRHPYHGLPASASWRQAVAGLPGADVDPVVDCRVRLRRSDRVATAGSCFAQHIARHLKTSGFNYYVVEPGHPLAAPDILARHQYGLFSARYGNIYTSRQLVQLVDRAFGAFTPLEDAWHDGRGHWCDPFRPSVQPGGFVSLDELRADRARHLAAVRQMFANLDVFVFTLGLTETWVAAADGAAFPMCPGVIAGRFDADRYRFVNLTVDDVVADLEAFLDRLRAVNGRARVILTVSPVPLAATAEPRHVLVSTTLSKAVLRVAADVVAARHPQVAYFPSFEIITGNHARGRYFAADLRSVTEEGVHHVMRLFLRHATEGAGVATPPVDAAADGGFGSVATEIAEVLCDEESLA